MQQRSGTERRRATDRDAAQTLGRQPQGEGEDDLEQPRTPLSAREFEHPRRRAEDKAAPAGGKRGVPDHIEQVQPGDRPPDENL